MPVLPASGYPTPVAPSIEPLPTAPGSGFDIRAPVEAFGGASAAALSNLGTSFEKASANWEKVTNEFDRVSALEARTKADLAANAVLYGDVNDPTSIGYFGLEGRAKLDARADTIKSLRTIYDDAGKTLVPGAKRLFDESTRGHRLGVEANIALDSVKALTEYRKQVDAGAITLAGQNADRLALTDDLKAWDLSVGEGVQRIQVAGERANKPPEVIEAEKNAFRAGRIVEKAAALAERDPEASMRFLDNNRQFFVDPSAFEHIYGVAKGKAEARQVDELASPGGARSGDAGAQIAATLRARGWSDAAIEGALNNAMQESSLNPEAKGAAGERGLFQFHPGSHITPFTQAYKGDWSPQAQANYMADVVERTMPGYAQSTDGRTATGRFLREFEKPKDQSDAELNRRTANAGASRTILGQGAPTSLASEHARIDASGAPQEVRDKAKARVNARYAQQTQVWEQTEDRYRRAIRDGDASITPEFLDAETDAGRLGPSQRQQLEAYRHGVVKEREALSDALALVAAAKNGEGVLDPTNEKHRNAVTLDWANTPKAGTPQEQWQQALSYIGKVNIVPGPVKSAITGNLFSGNEGRATAGARQYRDLVALNPMLGEGFNADARAMAATLNTMAGFGMVPKEAFTQAQAQMRVPQAEQEARRKSFDSVRGESERDRLAGDTKAITSRHNSLFVNDPDTIPDAMLFDFREAAQTFYARTGNLDAAYQAAYDTMAIKWAPSRVGADGLRWTKNAPESLYQAPGRTDSDWMNTQLLADVNANAPKPFTLNQLHIVPEPEVPGKKPGYFIWYLTEAGHFDYIRDANRVPLTWRPNWQTSSVRAQEAEDLRRRHEERARQPVATAPVPPVPQPPLPEDAPFLEKLKRAPSQLRELRSPAPSGTRPPPT